MEDKVSENTINLKTALSLLEAFGKCTDDYVYLWELKHRRVWFPGQIYDKFALQKADYYELEDILSVTYPNDRTDLYTELKRIADGLSEFHDMEYRWLDRNGKTVWINCRGTVYKDENGIPMYVLGRVSYAALKHKVDSTTGIFNKVKLGTDLEKFLNFEMPGALLLLGIDNLKHTNIQFGWEYGDQILRHVAAVLEKAVGNPLQNYKLDGDCFAVCLNSDSRKAIQDVFDKIQNDLQGTCTVSAGVVRLQEPLVENIRTAYQYAEQALDIAKKQGKNRLQFFNEEEYFRKISEIELLEELKDNIRKGCTGFYLVYQPQIQIKRHCLHGAEVLLRYHSQKRGVILPDKFIPLLEESGLICEVGYWVLRQALDTCRRWREILPDFCMGVNLSYAQLKQPDISETVLTILRNSGLPGNALTLEVTESMQLQEYEKHNQMFLEWKKEGITISVDDFGTGYSNLSYLKYLEVDQMKIDRCFVSGIENNSYDYCLIRNLTSLASDLEMQILFEGVESKEELQVLEELNVELVQGYLFSKPCTEDIFFQKYIQNGEIYTEIS